MARRRRTVIDGLKVLASIFKARVLRLRFPLAVSWNVTFRCNCRCDYCATASAPPRELGTDEAMKLLDDLEALGTRWLTLSGGEPLIRDDIGELIRRGVEKRLHVRVSTNGILVPDKLDDLRGIDTMTVSLDGPEDVNDRVRGKGTFRAAMAAVEACKDAGIHVDLMCTLTRHNLEAADELLDIASRYQVAVMFQPATSWLNLGKQANPVAPDVEDCRRTMQHLVDRKRSGAPILNSLAGLRYLANWPEPAKVPCYAGILLCCVQPDGTIVACSLFEDSFLGGKDFRQAPAAERFREASRSRVNCRQCWCGPLLELNLMLALRPGPILNALRMGV